MKVRELIDGLADGPPDAEVRIAVVDDDDGRGLAGIVPASNLPGQAVRCVFLARSTAPTCRR